MTATFNVPALPSEPGALLYFFSGVQLANNSIVQPVLQYGDNGTFGGNHWTIASWLLNCNGWSFYSEPIIVDPNDTIVASMDKTFDGAVYSWRITTTNSRTGEETTLRVDNLNSPPLNFYGGAFEAYHVADCVKQYPASRSVTFQDITIRTPAGGIIAPVWGQNTPGPCPGLTVLISTTMTTLQY